jgi:tRNA (guanine-N7-)-methyltransferase
MVLDSIKEVDAPLSRYLNWNIFEPFFGYIKHLEIGIGNGEYLVNNAKVKSKEIFYGIEYNPKYYRKGLLRAQKANVNNVFLICSEAKTFLNLIVPDNVFDFIHINFPDPWPKKRHLKRRLVDKEFAKDLYRVLKPKGFIYIASDFYEYFLNIVSILELNGFVKSYFGNSPYPERLFKTKYEKRFENKGIPLFYAILKKNIDKEFSL